MMQVPVQAAISVGLLLQGSQDLVQNALLNPAVEADGHRLLGTVLHREVAPGRSGPIYPQDRL